LCVNVPEFEKFPEIFNVELGAVNVPDEIVKLVVVTAPVEPANEPPETVNPPSNVCELEPAVNVPPESVTALLHSMALFKYKHWDFQKPFFDHFSFTRRYRFSIESCKLFKSEIWKSNVKFNLLAGFFFRFCWPGI
jgi:hypothetical protein